MNDCNDLFKFEDRNDYTGKNEWEIIDIAMNNAYKFLMGGEDWSKMDDPIVWMPVNNEKAESKEIFEAGKDEYDSSTTVNILIDYFTGKEEYEKCAKLVKLKKVKAEEYKKYGLDEE